MADARYISDRVKKQLYALSGNECANPSCNNKLVFPDDNAKDDQICHIEAASPDGPRYNPNQTDDERRGFDNLILLCHKCHDMIDNNPDKYPVELLKKWKREHEAKYQHNYKAKTFSFSVPDGLLPRDKEADNLFDKIITHRIFNLIGVGGSGKSSLAYLMMQKHESDFNEIANVVVNNNIKNDFVEQINKTLNLEFERNEDAFPEIIANLQNNFKSEQPNLLVLDINETSDKTKNDEIINTIIKTKDILNGWKILILSREKVDTRNRIDTHNLNDHEDVEFLKELFLQKAGERYNDFGDFAELFKIVFYNPLLTEQLALYLHNDPEPATIEDIKKILYGASFKEEDLQGLAADRHDETIVSFLTNLIKYNDFNDNEKNLLRHFVLWQAEYIGYEVIKDLLNGVFTSDDELKNTLKSLSKRAILDTNNNQTLGYKLHGLLAESLREQIEIEKQDYSVYLNNISDLIKNQDFNFIPYADYIGNSLCEYNIISKQFDKLLPNIGLKFDDIWKPDYAIKVNEKYILITIAKVKLEPNDYELKNNLAASYNNLANYQMNYLKNYKSANDNYNKAIAIREELPKDNPKYQNSLAAAFNNLGQLQAEILNDYKSAQENFYKAIAIREKINNDNPKYQNDLVLAYINIANLKSYQFNDFSSAKQYFNKAIEIGNQLPKNNTYYQGNLASAYYNFGYCQFYKLKDYKSAEHNFIKAIEICEKISKNNLNNQMFLAKIQNDLAVLQQNNLNDYESAINNYHKAISIWESLPNNNPKAHNYLTQTYNNYAFLQAYILNDYKSAQDNYEKAIKICEQLSKDDTDYKHNLLSLYYALAYLQMTYLKNYESAKYYLDKAIEIGEHLSSINNEDLKSLASAYNGLAYIFKNYYKNYNEAKATFKKAIEIAQELSNNNSNKYLIDLINYKHTLAEIYFDTNDIKSVKSILSEIKPQAEQCLLNNPNDKWTQTVNKEINKLWEKISTLES